MVDSTTLLYVGLSAWLGSWSLVGLVLMAYDKHQAKSRRQALRPERISERSLQEIALLGGFTGIAVGAKLFHHKTSKLSFWPPVAAALVVWAIAIFLLFQRFPPPTPF